MEQERPRLRLALEETVSLQKSAEALQNGDVDLAIVRSDDPAAASGGTIVIVRRIPLVIMVPAQSSVKAMNDLVGKRIAVLEGTSEGDPLLTTVMEPVSYTHLDVYKRQLVESVRQSQLGALTIAHTVDRVAILAQVLLNLPADHRVVFDV